jgi:hypothetical protein
MIFTGTVYLNEESNNRHQFVYGTLYGKTFVGLFAKFTISNSKLIEVSLVPITYNGKSKLMVESAQLIPGLNRRSGIDIVEIGRTPTPINCLTLTVKVSLQGIPEFIIKNLSIDLQAETYFEVLREGDEGSLLESGHPKFSTECLEYKDKEGNPGRICPRGYSKIIL